MRPVKIRWWWSAERKYLTGLDNAHRACAQVRCSHLGLCSPERGCFFVRVTKTEYPPPTRETT